MEPGREGCIVRISAKKGYEGLGAGVWVGSDVILTLDPLVALANGGPYVARYADPPHQSVIAVVTERGTVKGLSTSITLLKAVNWSELSRDFEPVRFSDIDYTSGPVEAAGFPSGNDPQWDSGIVASAGDGLAWIDWHGAGATRGYAGAPVFLPNSDEVIGVAVPSEWSGSGRSILIPTKMLLDALPELRDVNPYLLALKTSSSSSVSSGSATGHVDLSLLDNLRTADDSGPGHHHIAGCAISPDGKKVVSASDARTLKVWDLESGHEILTLDGHSGSVNGCATSQDGRKVVSASHDRTLKVWNLESGREELTLTGHSDSVLACAISPDCTKVVSASDDRTLRVWDLESGREISSFHGHSDSVHGCAISPDGKSAVSASWDKTLKVWDLQSGQNTLTLSGHSLKVNSCAISPDGKRLVSASDDRTMKVWDLQSGSEILTLLGHSGSVHGCAISPDGKKVVSASYDGTLKVWDLESGRSLLPLVGHHGPINGCAIGPDGKKVVSASDDGTLKVWNLDSGSELGQLGPGNLAERTRPDTPPASAPTTASEPGGDSAGWEGTQPRGVSGAEAGGRGQSAAGRSQPERRAANGSPPSGVLDTIQSGAKAPRADWDVSVRTHALSDAPSEKDLLGYSDYAAAIARFIQDPRTEQPLVIGIDAPWGMGKTTLMRMIRTELANIGPALLEKKDPIPGRPFHQAKPRTKNSIPTVWFNAWKYDKEESLWAALIIEILQEVKSRLGFWRRQWFYLKLTWNRTDLDAFCQDIVRGLPAYFISAIVALVVVIVARVAFNRLEGRGWLTLPLVASAGAFVYEALAHYTKVFGPLEAKLAEYTKEPDYRKRVGFLKELEDDLVRIVSLVTNKGRWPLVVFIDDLDRCAPPKPVEIIEAINLLLSVQHCIFVIGMDSQAVAASIEAKYKDMAAGLRASDGGSSALLGRRFLEKIVQVYFRIPPPEAGAFDRFLKETLEGRTQGAAPIQTPLRSADESTASQKAADDELKRKVAEDLIRAEQRAGNTVLDNAVAKVQEQTQVVTREVLQQARKAVGAEQAEETGRLVDAVNEAATYLGQNMRKMKRFINAYRLQLAIAKERGLTSRADFDHMLLARMLIFETRWPDIFESIATDGELLPKIRKYFDMVGTIGNKEVPQEEIDDYAEEMARIRENRWASEVSKNKQLEEFMRLAGFFRKGEAETYLHLVSITAFEPASSHSR